MMDSESLKSAIQQRVTWMHDEKSAYFLPCESLRTFISNFTICFPDETMISDTYTIMPHGSVTYVLFQIDEEVHSLLFGPTTKPKKVGDIANQCDVIFIIEFQPAGFYPFTKMKQTILTDNVIPFGLIDASFDLSLRNFFAHDVSIEMLLVNIEKELQKRICVEYPKELANAISQIIKKKGNITSEEISEQAFYSSRHVNRMFNTFLGMSMKSFSRLVRINKSFHLLNDRSHITLTSISDALGFYDVSHFVKDFKVVTGLSPQQYRNDMSDFYSEIAKF